MNTSDEIKTQVFCSHCGVATPDFIEWGDEFFCEAHCVSYLPTPQDFEMSQADSDWLVSAGWGDDEDYGYYD